ncbi:MAG: alpha-mannosidase, partial [Bacteroidales bacterium]|nr:alpha-mannosidase [Bacteroidales bacterium]
SQHHDCWIVPYNRLNKRGNWADNVALWTGSSLDNCDEVISRLLASDGLQGASIYQVGVVNTTAFPRQETVCADIPEGWPAGFRITGPDGSAVPYLVEGGKAIFRASAPALGIASYTFSRQGKSTRVIPSVRTSEASDGLVKVAAGEYTLTFCPAAGGVITSVVSKDGKEYVDMGSGQALNQLSGWFYDEKRWHSSSDSPATVEVSRAEGILTKITVRGTIASEPFTQTITVADGSRRIDFDLKIDWEKNHGIGKFAQKDAYNNRHRAFYDTRYDLNVLFPAAVEAPTLYKDAPFDVCESALENTYFDMWDGIKHNVILDWVDLCGENGKSLALLTDHTTSYTYGPDFPLALTVQFSGNGLWGRNYSITRPTEIRYAIVPHSGKWDNSGIQKESQAWNEPLRTIPGAYPRDGILDLDGTGFQLSALQTSEDGCLLRLYNADGDSSPRKIRLGLPAKTVSEVNLLGEETGNPSVTPDKDGIIMEVAIPRFGIKTFKIK